MSFKPSARVSQVKPSATIQVSTKAAELRAQGRDIVSLGVGEPDFDTPDHIKLAAKRAIDAGETKYTPTDGTPQVKNAVRKKLMRDNQLEFDLKQIIVSSGAKQSLFNAMLAMLNPGDEVLIPAPYWVSYPDMVKLADGEPVILQTEMAEDFKITPRQLEARITDRTRLLILNAPSNPTGKMYSEAELRALGEVLQQQPKVFVMTDEIYEHIYWADYPYVSFLNACPDLRDRCLLINGVSKAYSMTGWRIGFGAGPVELIREMKKIQGQSTSNPCSISQAAAAAALVGPQDSVETMRQAFKERHDYFVPALNDLPGVTCPSCDGAYYAFPSFEQVIEQRDDIRDDVALAEYLLENAGVATVPGSAFGAPGHLRCSFATGMTQLKEAIRRLKDCLDQG